MDLVSRFFFQKKRVPTCRVSSPALYLRNQSSTQFCSLLRRQRCIGLVATWVGGVAAPGLPDPRLGKNFEPSSASASSDAQLSAEGTSRRARVVDSNIVGRGHMLLRSSIAPHKYSGLSRSISHTASSSISSGDSASLHTFMTEVTFILSSLSFLTNLFSHPGPFGTTPQGPESRLHLTYAVVRAV
jgi:hypothetical protein